MRDQNTEKLVEKEKHVAVKHYIREEKSQDVQNADGIRAVECLGLIFLLGMYIDHERKMIACSFPSERYCRNKLLVIYFFCMKICTESVHIVQNLYRKQREQNMSLL